MVWMNVLQGSTDREQTCEPSGGRRKIERVAWKRTLPLSISCCCCSVAQLCMILCDPMPCRTPGFLVLHHLQELAQTHVHRAGAFQPACPLSSPSPPAFHLSQHQGKIVSQWKFAAWHRELTSRALRELVWGWRWREVQEGGDLCIPDSCCSMAETNTTL